MKFKKGDNVIIISGKDKDKKGKIVKIFRDDDKIAVEGVNLQARRTRAKRGGEKGQTVKIAAPVHASNALLYCPTCRRGVRLKTLVLAGKKKRVCVKCNKEL
jgi:large subunit ribosomal protein L24